MEKGVQVIVIVEVLVILQVIIILKVIIIVVFLVIVIIVIVLLGNIIKMVINWVVLNVAKYVGFDVGSVDLVSIIIRIRQSKIMIEGCIGVFFYVKNNIYKYNDRFIGTS